MNVRRQLFFKCVTLILALGLHRPIQEYNVTALFRDSA